MFICSEFCKAIRHQSSYLDGAPDLAAFNDHLLEAAFLEFRRVNAVADDLAVLGADLGQPDPFRDCPVCAIVSKDTLEDGKHSAHTKGVQSQHQGMSAEIAEGNVGPLQAQWCLQCI